ncbi:MAG: hypothetical protein RR219_08695 [Clostridiales bacterium]
MKNTDIRTEIYGADIRFWQVAEGLGVAAETLSRKLRHELPDGEKEKIRAIIKELAKN